MMLWVKKTLNPLTGGISDPSLVGTKALKS